MSASILSPGQKQSGFSITAAQGKQMGKIKQQAKLLKAIACAVAVAALTLPTAGAHASPVNVALASNGGVATQSSIYGTSIDGRPTQPSWAIDGITNGNWFAASSMTHTQQEYQPWWQVTLGGGATIIEEINVWNRTDCCANRLDGFNVTILNGGNVVWQSLNNSYLAAMPEASFSIPSIVGDTVRISLNGTNYLSLVEVQVWGTAASSVSEPGSIALAAAGLAAMGFSRRRRDRQA
jgi:hypothetical protein